MRIGEFEKYRNIIGSIEYENGRYFGSFRHAGKTVNYEDPRTRIFHAEDYLNKSDLENTTYEQLFESKGFLYDLRVEIGVYGR